MSPRLDWLRERPFAHRGLHDAEKGIPENSIAAFAAAIEAGYPIELDVQTTRDGKAMILHDADMARMTGVDRNIHDTDVADLGQIRLSGTDESIPSLVEALDLIAGKVPVIVELKSRLDDVGDMEEEVHGILSGYKGLFAVTSFDARTLTWFRKKQPDWLRGHNIGSRYLGPYEPWWRRLAWQYLYDVDDAQPHFVVYDRRDLPMWITGRWRAGDRPLLSYTIRDRAEMDRLAAHVDNIIFEGFRP